MLTLKLLLPIALNHISVVYVTTMTRSISVKSQSAVTVLPALPRTTAGALSGR